MDRNVINLNRFRKKKQREEHAKEADLNRVRHGQTKTEKERALADQGRATRALDGARLEGPELEHPHLDSEELALPPAPPEDGDESE